MQCNPSDWKLVTCMVSTVLVIDIPCNYQQVAMCSLTLLFVPCRDTMRAAGDFRTVVRVVVFIHAQSDCSNCFAWGLEYIGFFTARSVGCVTCLCHFDRSTCGFTSQVVTLIMLMNHSRSPRLIRSCSGGVVCFTVGTIYGHFTQLLKSKMPTDRRHRLAFRPCVHVHLLKVLSTQLQCSNGSRQKEMVQVMIRVSSSIRTSPVISCLTPVFTLPTSRTRPVCFRVRGSLNCFMSL